MPGHSIPGVKGFKGTSLEDGRAASSAFQMKESPLHEKLESGLGWTKKEKGKDKDKYLSRSKLAGESGTSYAIRQAMRLWHERKNKKEKEENPSKVMEEKTNEDKTKTESEYAEFGTDPRQDQNNYDEHGNYKPDYPDIYPDFEIAPTLSSEGKMESLISDLPEDHPGRGGEIDPDYVPEWEKGGVEEVVEEEEPSLKDLSSGATTSDWDAKSEGGHSMNDLVRMRDEARNNGDKELEEEIQASINEGYKR